MEGSLSDVRVLFCSKATQSAIQKQTLSVLFLVFVDAVGALAALWFRFLCGAGFHFI